MAEVRELFPTLEEASGAGAAPRVGQDGATAAGGINGQIGFAFKDSSGNVVLPQLDASGRISVTQAAPGTSLQDSSTATAGALNTPFDVSVITLTATESYVAKTQSSSSFQPTLWKMEQIDDATTTELARWVTGPGDFNYCCTSDCIEFTAGASGTQQLKITATQLRGGLTDAHAWQCALQKA